MVDYSKPESWVPEGVTELPWASHHLPATHGPGGEKASNEIHYGEHAECVSGWVYEIADANYIAAACNLLPEVLAAVAAAEEELDRGNPGDAWAALAAMLQRAKKELGA